MVSPKPNDSSAPAVGSNLSWEMLSVWRAMAKSLAAAFDAVTLLPVGAGGEAAASAAMGRPSFCRALLPRSRGEYMGVKGDGDALVLDLRDPEVIPVDALAARVLVVAVVIADAAVAGGLPPPPPPPLLLVMGGGGPFFFFFAFF